MEKNKTSIIFTGDIGFDKYMDKKWEDEELISHEIIEFFNSADHVAANIEGALISVDESESHGAFFHAMNPRAVSVFEKMNADIWSLGNNHTTDAGREGIESTLNIAKECGCKCFGAGLDINGASNPLYINEAGGIGIIGVT